MSFIQTPKWTKWSIPNSGIISCQQKYGKEVLERFGLEKGNMVSNPIVPRQFIRK
jgi:hypothetical protein